MAQITTRASGFIIMSSNSTLAAFPRNLKRCYYLPFQSAGKEEIQWLFIRKELLVVIKVSLEIGRF